MLLAKRLNEWDFDLQIVLSNNEGVYSREKEENRIGE